MVLLAAITQSGERQVSNQKVAGSGSILELAIVIGFLGKTTHISH